MKSMLSKLSAYPDFNAVYPEVPPQSDPKGADEYAIPRRVRAVFQNFYQSRATAGLVAQWNESPYAYVDIAEATLAGDIDAIKQQWPQLHAKIAYFKAMCDIEIRKRTVYISVRPAETAYDKNYKAKQTPEVINPHLFTLVVTSTLQDYVAQHTDIAEAQVDDEPAFFEDSSDDDQQGIPSELLQVLNHHVRTNVRKSYARNHWIDSLKLATRSQFSSTALFFDSIYYFQPSDFNKITWFSAYVDNAAVAGLNFMGVPGAYDLPLREGRYVVERDMILMNTRGGSELYSHPHTHYMQAQ